MPKSKLEKTSLAKLRKAAAEAEAKAEAVRAVTRGRIISIARDLTSAAAGLARKGRPRLLAVLAKIASDSPSEKFEKRLKEELRHRAPTKIVLAHRVPRPPRPKKPKTMITGNVEHTVPRPQR